MIHKIITLIKLINYLFLILLSSNLLGNERILLGTSTSVNDSGLMKIIKTVFEKNFDYTLDVISYGTGQIINMAKRGDIDIIVVHHEKSEEDFMNQEFGISRQKLMYNKFFIVGPSEDPARIQAETDLKKVMLNIYN